LPKYNKISWTALKKNSANKSYRIAIKKFNGHQYPKFNENYSNLPDNTVIRYWIDKNE
jgi:hypothetical protein